MPLAHVTVFSVDEDAPPLETITHRQKGFALEPGPQSGFGHYRAQEVRTLAWLKSTTILKLLQYVRKPADASVLVGGLRPRHGSA